MIRGSKRRTIFRDERDRPDFLHRVAARAEGGAVAVYAWALLPKHCHLLVRTGARPLARDMRSLLPGDAGAFNPPLPAVSCLPARGPGRGPSRLHQLDVAGAPSGPASPAGAPESLPPPGIPRTLPPPGALPPAPRPAIDSP